jgi:glycosyltransferase involved in cell wall biosynthesis
LKVLHVIPSVDERDGGPSYAIGAFARALRENGIEMSLVTTAVANPPVANLVPQFERDGIPCFAFHRNFRLYKISFALARWVNRNVRQFDLIHIHAVFSFSSLMTARAAQRYGIPYIVRPLGILNRWGMENRRPLLKRLSFRTIELSILRKAAAIHYTTEAERIEAAEVHPDIRRLASFVIPVPVSVADNLKSAPPFSELFPQAKGRRLILFLSRLDLKKGIELLLKSFATLSQREPDVTLVIAGEGTPSYVETLRRLAADLKISQAVLWVGHLKGSQKGSALAAAAMFVLPSYSENFGIAAAEALAAGVPTILTDAVALSRDAAAADAALVIKPDQDALQAAMSRMLNDGELRHRLSVHGAAFAAELYSHRAVGAALARQYRQISGEN